MPDSVAKMKKLVADGVMDEITSAKASAITGDNGQVTSVTIQPKEGDAVDVEVDHVLVFFGLAPKLGPIANWGLDINRKTINVDTEKFETSEPGIYAVGDINYYPGKKKLILCGFHEAALAAFAIKKRIEPNRKALETLFQYSHEQGLADRRLTIEELFHSATLEWIDESG